MAFRATAGKASRVKKYAGERQLCKECKRVSTKDPSGVCAVCRAPERAKDYIGEKYEAAVFIPRPAGFNLMDKPCTKPGRYKLFDKPNASQAVRNLCWSCPAYDWCLAWGLGNPEIGIWGGLGEKERAIVREGGRDTRQGPQEPPGFLTADDRILVA